MNDDIVTRLRLRPSILRKNQFGDMETDRAATALFDDCHAIMREAADEIELLRSTLTDCRIEIESIRAQRDEARREICMNATKEPYRQMCGSGILLPQDAARERGWDCFKEDGK